MDIINNLFTVPHIAAAVAALLAMFGGFLLKLFHSEVRRRNIAVAVKYGYGYVEEMSRLDGRENSGLDKAAAGLKAVNDWMVANGWRKLTEKEALGVKLSFSALSGAEHAAVKAGAAVAAKAALDPSSPSA